MLTVIVTGPTCSGKGRIASALAHLLDAEIISLDSMKVYRHMDIGTAKPDPSCRSRVPYHLIDVAEPHEEFSVGRYVREALAAAASILARRKRVIFAGGTPLYLWNLVRGFCPAPQGDPVLRERLNERARVEGLAALHGELGRVDPAAAAKIHPHDQRRIVRALEVYALTGQPFTAFWRNSVIRLPPASYRLFGISWPREDLYRRINERVLRMVEAGLFAEAERVARLHGPLSRTVRQCIGYREIWEGAARGEDEAATVAKIQLNTRHFARKQGTWFRRFPQMSWLSAGDRDFREIAAAIARTVSGGAPALPEA
jgi:tRNA dimethylallyltransferase